MLFQVAHDPAGGIESKGAATCQQDCVYFMYQVHGAEQVGFTSGRRTATHIDPANGRSVAENDGTAGARFQVCVVSYANAGNICNIIVHLRCNFPSDSSGTTGPTKT